MDLNRSIDLRRAAAVATLAAVLALGAPACGDDEPADGPADTSTPAEGAGSADGGDGEPGTGDPAGEGDGTPDGGQPGGGETGSQQAVPDPAVVEETVTYLQQDPDVTSSEATCMASLLIRHFGNEAVQEALAGGEDAIAELRASDPEADAAFVEDLEQCWAEGTAP